MQRCTCGAPLAVMCALFALSRAAHLGTASSASLRGVPAVTTPSDAITQAITKAINQAAANVTAGAAANGTVVAAANVTAAAAANGTAIAAAPQRKSLDVGFSSFENDAVREVERSINSSLSGPSWNDESRAKVASNATAMLRATLKTELKPIKQSIGKTWMVLPEDEQKDQYVEQLRTSFASSLAEGSLNIGRHANTSLARMATSTTTDLPEQACQALALSIFQDHCYVKPVATIQEAAAALPGQFCIPSLLHNLIRRLNDSESMVSMTMKFEAKALAMLQQQKRQEEHAQREM